jgi:16S rRNA (cytosine967-C5)-methyltransferase
MPVNHPVWKHAIMTPRHLALEILLAVINKGESLSAVAPRLLPRLSDSRNRSLAFRLTLDALRSLNRFSWMRDQLLERAFTGKDMDVALLLTLGISQLCDPDLPVHASLNETVEVARSFKKKPWAVGLVNGVLRNFQRRQEELLAAANKQDPLFFTHPQWLLTQLQQAWPTDWRAIAQGNNTPADLCLRLAPRINRADYLAQLPEALNAQAHPSLAQAILLDSTDVTALPGFDEGDFSVQDASAQWAAHILQPQAGEVILDACAAPGGKTTHLLELSNNQAQLTALDIEAKRLDRIQENLDRLGLNATLITADAANTQSWWRGQAFDAILLDAPCSATGIIRRHPDIKWHRKPRDIEQLTQTQADLLDALWSLLKPNGRLLYATCSLLPAENSEQIRAFLARTPNARLQPLSLANSHDTGFGSQFLPTNAQQGDGFFYALLTNHD